MKKNYFLSLILAFVTAISFSQVLASDNFSYADGSLVPNGGWAREGGTAGDFQVTSGEAVVQHGTPSEDVKLAFTSVAGDVYVGFDFSVDDLGAPFSGSDAEYFAHLDFKARVDIQAPTGAGDYAIGISSGSSSAESTWATDLTFGTSYRAIVKFDQITGTAQLWINPSVATDTSISGSGSGAFTVSEFELRQSDSSENETVRVDDLMVGQTFNDVLVFAAPVDPSITINAPSNGTEFDPSTTEVNASISLQNFTLSGDNGSGASDGSGDGYIVQELVTSAGTFTENSFTDTDQTIELIAGQSYTINVELVDNAGASLSPAVTATTTFSVASYTQVANLAALRAGTVGEFYEVTGEVVLTFDTGNSRNQKYIEDSSAAILIDDNDGIITTTYNVGDGGTGLVGKLGEFNGLLQFVPTEDPGTPDSTGNPIVPQVVTITDLNTSLDTYESEWITINDVTFVDGNGTATFAASSNYDINDAGANTLVFRTAFSSSDFIGTEIPTSSANITGLASEFSGTAQIFGISSENIVLDNSSFNQIDGFGAFPNPVDNKELTIRSSNSETKEVTIYSVLGKQVLSNTFSGNQKTLDVSAINSGIYILKVVENGKIATKKLVVR